MLERTLAAEGYDVTAAPGGGEALAAIERSVPDLLVLDVGLPDLDGFAVCRRIRGKGLARAMVRSALEHPEHQGLRRWALATRDAHGVYQAVGFEPLPSPDRWMYYAPQTDICLSL